MANDWRSDYVLTGDDLNTLADLVTAGDPRAMQVPNGTVAALIAMLRDAEAEWDAVRSELTENPDPRTQIDNEICDATPLHWIKASASAGNGNCVEMASLPGGGVAVRDSKNPHGPVLRYTAQEWAAFLDGAKADELDGLA